MKITATGIKVTLKDTFVQNAEKRLGKLDKYFTQPARATVKVTVDKNEHTVEVTVKSGKFLVRCEKSRPTMELALRDAVDGLETQILKNKKKLQKKYTSAPARQSRPEEEEDFEIVRKKVFRLEPQTPEDAILEMNMLGHSFFMFKDIVTGEINVVYKREDGKYGLLIPQ